MARTRNQLAEAFKLAQKFVRSKKGEWGHGDWEKLVKEAQKCGLDMDDEGKRNLGNLLETGKVFFERPLRNG
jgi:hypothetical protein